MPVLIASVMSWHERMLVVCNAIGNWQQSDASRHSPEQVRPVPSTPKCARSQMPVPTTVVAIQTRSLSQSLLTRQLSPRATELRTRRCPSLFGVAGSRRSTAVIETVEAALAIEAGGTALTLSAERGRD